MQGSRFIPVRGHKDLESIDGLVDLETFSKSLGVESESLDTFSLVKKIVNERPYNFLRTELRLFNGVNGFTTQEIFIIGFGTNNLFDLLMQSKVKGLFYLISENENPEIYFMPTKDIEGYRLI